MIDFVAKARRVIELEKSEIERLAERIDESFSRAIELLQKCVETRGKIVVIGVGKSGHIGEKIAATLTSTGSPAVVLDSLNALHGDLGVVADGDVILALSYSGETDELINILSALSRFDVKIISMTGSAESFLAQNSHIHLDVSVAKEACPLNLAPTSSTTTMLVLGDALAMVLLEARGFNQDDFARFHPGGRLGRSLLLKVNQIMRKADHLALVGEQTIVRDVLQAMTARRAGAAIVTNKNGELVGIFTHGDFARHFQNNPTLGAEPVNKFITRNPVTIHGEKLAAEVLRVLETHRIDDLVVVDELNRPIGLVDSQDLAGLKLL